MILIIHFHICFDILKIKFKIILNFIAHLIDSFNAVQQNREET